MLFVRLSASAFAAPRREDNRATVKLFDMMASPATIAEPPELLGVFSPRRAGQLAGVGGDRIGQSGSFWADPINDL
jgi:hypothetical protein